MRLIDADVAIEELTDRSHQAAKRVGTDSPFWEGLVIARRIVKNLPTIQPEPQWIPVGERLPEEPGYYITSNEYGGVIEDFYCDDYFWIADRNAYKVIAWMPLPEAYKPNK